MREKALRGGAFKSLAQIITFVVRMGSTAALARMLDPRDFGLVAMATAITGILSLFRDAGLSLATVQRASITYEQLSTLFWLNVAIGVALTLLCAAAAPAVAHFYNDPRLFWVTLWTAPGFLLGALGMQHNALLMRQMRFSACAAIDVASVLAGAIVGIGMAYLGYGYWSLVGVSLAMQAAFPVGAWLAAGWVPGKPHRNAEILSMIRLGGAVTLNNIVIYVAYNADKILLGRYWGAETLGSYGRAYQLVNIPTENINSAVGSVALSTLSRVQGDTEKVKAYFLKGYSIVVALTIPATVACAVFAEDIVAVLLGPKWGSAAEIVRLLAPTIAVFALINPMFWLVFSAGLMARSVKIAVVIAALVITAYTLGLPYGAPGVATAYSLAMLVWLVPHICWCVHGTPVRPSDVLRSVIRPVVAGAITALVCVGLKASGVLPTLPPVRLILGGGVLSAVYLVVLLYVMGQRRFYVDLVKTLFAKPAPQVPGGAQELV
ncbi:MAG TPA: lipopolysaccharide biosynthesis protein [Steroidobacteraceae bacterium]